MLSIHNKIAELSEGSKFLRDNSDETWVTTVNTYHHNTTTYITGEQNMLYCILTLLLAATCALRSDKLSCRLRVPDDPGILPGANSA